MENNKGTKPAENAKLYIDTAINDNSEHSADVTVGSSVDAPQEVIWSNFDAKGYCQGYYDDVDSYNDLGEWYHEGVVACYNSRSCDILITNALDQGGVMYGSRAGAVGGGPALANLDTYDLYGCTDAHQEMSAVLHEVGHALMSLTEEKEHNSGNTYEYNGETLARTPFADKDGGTNICDVNYPNNDDGCRAMGYSECAEKNMG